MGNPKISVITVCYNVVSTIERTIESVLSQDYPNTEYIIIDGNSTDGTKEILEKYKDRVSCIISEPDKGIYDAMNKGIKKASGEWVNLMNAGDYFANSHVISNVFKSDINETTSFLYSNVYRPINGELVEQELSFEKGCLIHQTIIYKKELHFEHGYYVVSKPIIVSDYLFFVRIPKEQVQKVNFIIAVYEGGGISDQGDWAFVQSNCVDVVFRRKTFGRMIGIHISHKLKSFIPVPLKMFVKNLLKR